MWCSALTSDLRCGHLCGLALQQRHMRCLTCVAQWSLRLSAARWTGRCRAECLRSWTCMRMVMDPVHGLRAAVRPAAWWRPLSPPNSCLALRAWYPVSVTSWRPTASTCACFPAGTSCHLCTAGWPHRSEFWWRFSTQNVVRASELPLAACVGHIGLSSVCVDTLALVSASFEVQRPGYSHSLQHLLQNVTCLPHYWWTCHPGTSPPGWSWADTWLSGKPSTWPWLNRSAEFFDFVAHRSIASAHHWQRISFEFHQYLLSPDWAITIGARDTTSDLRHHGSTSNHSCGRMATQCAMNPIARCHFGRPGWSLLWSKTHPNRVYCICCWTLIGALQLHRCFGAQPRIAMRRGNRMVDACAKLVPELLTVLRQVHGFHCWSIAPFSRTRAALHTGWHGERTLPSWFALMDAVDLGMIHKHLRIDAHPYLMKVFVAAITGPYLLYCSACCQGGIVYIICSCLQLAFTHHVGICSRRADWLQSDQ